MTDPMAAPLDTLAVPDLNPWARLRAFLQVERQVITITLIYASVSGLLSLAIPLAVQSLVNTIAFETLLQPMVVLSVMLFAALAFQGFLLGIQTILLELMQRRAFVRVALDLAWRLPKVRIDALDGLHGPELVNRFFSVFTVQKAASLLLMDGAGLMLMIIINLTLLAFYHPMLFAFDVVLILTIVTILFGFGFQAVQTSLIESKYKYGMAAWLEEVALKMPSFKFGLAPSFAMRHADYLAVRYVHAREAHYQLVFKQLVGFLSLQALAASCLLGIGGYLVVQRQLSLGQLVASEFVVASVVAGLVKLTKHLETFYDLLAAVDKLGHLLALPLERQDGSAITVQPAAEGMSLVCKSLSYRYANGPLVLDGLDWSLPHGGRVGIVANNGVGKSTLADVLCGLREPTGGVIEVDGCDRRDLNLDHFRQHITLVRANDIIAGTIRENLLMGQTDPHPGLVWDSLKRVHLLDEIQSLPDGIQTLLATGGYPLSPKEANRLSLARVMVQQPRLVVIDGALDGLDPEVQASVLQALLDPNAPWSIIIISAVQSVLDEIPSVYRLVCGQLQPLKPQG